MESILFLGGLAPTIGIWGGGELGGEGVRTGDTGTKPLGGKGRNRGFEEKAKGPEGKEVSSSATTTKGWGVIKPVVGKSSDALGLNYNTISEERGVTRVSPSNPRPGGENSTRTLPKFKVWETPTEGITREWEEESGVSKEGQWKLSEIPGSTVEVPS